ncbi:hypothetical protein ACOMHN_029400 [Nucella lapillus]
MSNRPPSPQIKDPENNPFWYVDMGQIEHIRSLRLYGSDFNMAEADSTAAFTVSAVLWGSGNLIALELLLEGRLSEGAALSKARLSPDSQQHCGEEHDLSWQCTLPSSGDWTDDVFTQGVGKL